MKIAALILLIILAIIALAFLFFWGVAVWACIVSQEKKDEENKTYE